MCLVQSVWVVREKVCVFGSVCMGGERKRYVCLVQSVWVVREKVCVFGSVCMGGERKGMCVWFNLYGW